MEPWLVGLRMVQSLITSRLMAITLQLVTEDNLPIKKVTIGLEEPKRGKYLTFLIGGGCDANLVHADLIIDGEVRNFGGEAY